MSKRAILLFEKIAHVKPLEFGDITEFKEQCKLSTQVRSKLAKDCRIMIEVIDKAINIQRLHEINPNTCIQDRQFNDLFDDMIRAPHTAIKGELLHATRPLLIRDHQMFKDLSEDLENQNIEVDMALLSNRLGSLADRLGFTEDGRYFQIESIMVNSEIRNIRNSIQGKKFSPRIAGSRSEGTAKFNNQTDEDILNLHNDVKILNSDDYVRSNEPYIRMVHALETPAGYTYLQVCNHGEAILSKEQFELPDSFQYELISNKRCGILISNKYTIAREQWFEYYTFGRQGPAVTETDNDVDAGNDHVAAFVCETLPDEVLPWFERKRTYGWPNQETVERFKHMGCIVVPVGHKKSPNQHLEWRLSFTNQEKYLMHNLNMTQYRCYAILKYIKSDFIKQYTDSISSFHLKTALFYTIENNNQDIWQPENLSYVILKCLQQLPKWVADLNCPNFFIPQENMFEARLDNIDKLTDFFSSLFSKWNILFRLISYSCDDEKWQKVNYVSFCVHKRKLEMDNSNRTIENVLCEMPNITSKLWFLKTRQSQLKYFIEKCTNANTEKAFTNPFPEINVAHLFQYLTDPQYWTNPLIIYLLEKVCLKLIHNKPTLIASYEAQYSLIYMMSCLHLQLFVRDHDYQHIKDIDKTRLNEVNAFHISLKKATAFFTIKDHTSSLSILRNIFPMSKSYALCCHGDDKRLLDGRTFFEFTEFILGKLSSSSRIEMVNEVSKQCTMCLQFDTDEILLKPLIYEPLRMFGLSLSPRERYNKSYRNSVLIDPFFFASFLMYKNNEATDNKPDMNSALKHMSNMVIEHLEEPFLCHFDTTLNTMGHIYITKGWHRLAVSCFRRSLLEQPLYNAVKWQLMFLMVG